jgi:hypothetical protein
MASLSRGVLGAKAASKEPRARRIKSIGRCTVDAGAAALLLGDNALRLGALGGVGFGRMRACSCCCPAGCASTMGRVLRIPAVTADSRLVCMRAAKGAAGTAAARRSGALRWPMLDAQVHERTGHRSAAPATMDRGGTTPCAQRPPSSNPSSSGLTRTMGKRCTQEQQQQRTHAPLSGRAYRQAWRVQAATSQHASPAWSSAHTRPQDLAARSVVRSATAPRLVTAPPKVAVQARQVEPQPAAPETPGCCQLGPGC